MAKVGRITGIQELNKKLRENATLDDVKKVVQMNGSELASEAERKAPVDTGTLERSINLSRKDNGLTAVVEPSTDYQGYVEYGTRYMAAQPYMRPAFKKQVKQFKKDMERLVK
ncbi:TPA: HK97-gp10 family putative phage morphogenesis protein [Enterococcus faecalis]